MQAPTSRKVGTLLAMAEELGVSVEELADAAANSRSPSQVTVADLPAINAATSEGARLTYRPYWRRLVTAMGDRHLAAIRTSGLRSFVSPRRTRRRIGPTAATACPPGRIALAHWGVLPTRPRRRLHHPEPDGRDRKARPPPVTSSVPHRCRGGRDLRGHGQRGRRPLPDMLLLRFHLETGARQKALGLRLCDLDQARQCLRLREKNQTERWQPLSRTLLDALAQHAACREPGRPSVPSACPGGMPPSVYRSSDGATTPWWPSGGELSPRVWELGVSIHWCRHHRHARMVWWERTECRRAGPLPRPSGTS